MLSAEPKSQSGSPAGYLIQAFFLGTKAKIITFLSLDKTVKSDDSVGNDDNVEYDYG
jgi:hypothetical protein